MNNAAKVKSANRVLDLLEFIAPKYRPVSHSEIACSLNIPKSSLSQLLNNLVQRGYLIFDSHSRGYLMGDSLRAITMSSEHHTTLIQIARPVLGPLATKINETCSLNFIRGQEIEVIDRFDSTQPLTYNIAIGGRAPLYSISTGKAILAFLPKDELSRYLQKMQFERLTNSTLMSTKALKEDLIRVRAEGVAFSHEEYSSGVVGIAAPILDGSNYPIAAVNFVIPSVRLSDRLSASCASALLEATKTISAHF